MHAGQCDKESISYSPIHFSQLFKLAVNSLQNGPQLWWLNGRLYPASEAGKKMTASEYQEERKRKLMIFIISLWL